MSRIVLTVDRDQNRDLLRDWLASRHDVSAIECEGGLPERFDLCVTDMAGLATHGEALEERRQAEAPVFLPVLLLTSRSVEGVAGRGGTKVVDEFISIPVKKVELNARLEVLLRNRAQSLELKERLLDAQRLEAVGVLAGGVVHDLNNLLTVIHSSASVLAEVASASGGGTEEFEQIGAAVERASGLTRRLLSFSSRKPSGDEVVAPNHVIATTAKILEATVSENIEFIQELDPQCPPIRCDPVRLEQVVMNLVVNALDVLADGGRITLETERLDGANGLDAEEGRTPSVSEGRAPVHAALVVSDTGPGMDDETVERIFDPFFTTKESGTGLGLATVSRIVDEMGGAIEVESEPGQGTRFRIVLPGMADAAVEEQDDREEGEKEGGPETGSEGQPLVPDRGEGERRSREKRTVLVLDDEDVVRRIIVRILGDEGYRVMEAGTAGDAVALLKASDPAVDVVLSDSIIPGLTGSDLPDLLARATGRRVAVAFMSGYQRDEVVERLGPLGDAPFIHKPFTADELCNTVDELVEQIRACP